MTEYREKIEQNAYKIGELLDGENFGTVMDSIYLALTAIIEISDDPFAVYFGINKDIKDRIDELIKKQTTH